MTNLCTPMDRKFELLADALPQIVWICGADGQNIYFNQRWVDYTGLSLEESHGAGWNKPFHPDDQHRAWKAWDDAVHLKAPYSLEARLRRADGEYRWWLVRGVPSVDDVGSVASWFGTCTDIHDMKVATHVMLSTAIESMRDSVFITDIAGNFTHMNQAFADYHRFPSKAESLTRLADYAEVFAVFTPDGTEVPREQWPVMRAFRGESGEGLVLTIQRKDTGARWVGTHAFAPMRDGAGPIIGAVVTARDISEQVRLEESVLASNESVKRAHEIRSLALEAGELGAWESTLPDGILTWTDQCSRLLGLPAGKAVVKKDLRQAILAEDRSRLDAAISRSIDSKSQFDELLRVKWPDGSVHWLQCVGRAIYKGEEPVRIAGVLRRSRSSESRLIAEAIQQMLWIADDSEVIHFNQQWLDYCGATLASHLGHGWIDATHPDDQERLRQVALAAAHPEMTSFEQHYRLRRNDGAYRWCIGRARKLKLSSDGKALWYGTTIDVHDLHEALEEAQGANRAKAAFLATTSHELRTPLNAIIGFSTLLLGGDMGPLLDSQRKPLEIVRRSGEELLALVQDILDFTAIEAGSFRMNVDPTPLQGLLGDVRDQLVPRAVERGLELPAVDCEPDIRVMADPARLGQAVRNLVSNGLTYTDKGHVKISAAVDGKFARIDVIDTGIGIPTAELHKVFQAFQPIQRGKGESRRGTGLGLAITRRIVETMGGEVGYSSELGAGSQFWIKIPLA